MMHFYQPFPAGWRLRPESAGTCDTVSPDSNSARGGRDIVFAGALDRMFRAYETAGGTELWSVRLPDMPGSAPVTYSVNGKQYVAVVTGYTNLPSVLPNLCGSP
jgi:hypothetical protein